MQFAQNELVFYDRVGVCRVESVGKPPLTGLPPELLYYTLQPIYQTETILLPVTTKAYLRRLLTKQEAEALLHRLPELEPLPAVGMDTRAVTALYQVSSPVASCEVLARLAKAVYCRGQQRLAAGRRPAAADQRFRKFAENLLYGELAIALDVPREEIERHIAAHVSA